jgi:hypothetical protein
MKPAYPLIMTEKSVGRSVGGENAAGYRQHSHSCLQVSSRPMTKIFFLSYTCTCFEMGPSFRRERGRSLYVFRRYDCYTVVSARVCPRRQGVQVIMVSVHPLSLHCTKYYLYKVCRSQRRLCLK